MCKQAPKIGAFFNVLPIVRKSISVGSFFNIELTSAWTGALLSIPELWTWYDWSSAHWAILSIGTYCLSQQEAAEDKIAIHWCVEKATILSILLPADMTNGTKTSEQWNGRYVGTAWNPQAKVAVIQKPEEHDMKWCCSLCMGWLKDPLVLPLYGIILKCSVLGCVWHLGAVRIDRIGRGYCTRLGGSVQHQTWNCSGFQVADFISIKSHWIRIQVKPLYPQGSIPGTCMDAKKKKALNVILRSAFKKASFFFCSFSEQRAPAILQRLRAISIH